MADMDPLSPEKMPVGLPSDTLATSMKLSAEAGAAQGAGRLEEAVELYKKALESKIAHFGNEAHDETVNTRMFLGDCLTQLGKLDEANEVLEKVLKSTDSKDKELGGLDVSGRGAHTREFVGRLREAQGRWADAESVRRRGAAKGDTICASDEVRP